MRTSHIVLAPVAAVALALLASGCGAATPKAASAAEVVHGSYDKTTAAKTAKINLSEQIDQGGSAASQHVSVTGSGSVDFAHQTSNFSMQLPTGQSVRILYTGGVVYEKLPTALTSKLGGKPWLKIDLNKVAQSKYGASLQQLTANTPHDPADTLAYLRGASSKVTKAGTATIGGTATTHYKVTLDLDKAAKTPAEKQAIAKVATQLGTHSLPADVWIDKQGRLRKMTITEKITPPKASGSATSTGPVTLHLTETVSDFGVPVHVVVPPAAQTTDLTAKVAGAH